MRAVSSVVGAAIAIILIVGVMLAFMNYYSEINRIEYRQLRAGREHLVIRPHLNGSSVYVSILNNGPVDPVTIRYVIVKNISNGEIVFVRELWRTLSVGEAIDLEIFNTTAITGKFDIIAVTSNGAIIHLDPEYTGDGLLDQSDIDRILSNTTSAIDLVNPLVGWSFNKSLIIQNGSGEYYYLIPYLVGDVGWNSGVDLDYRNYIDSSVVLWFYDLDNSGKRIDFIKVYAYRRQDGYYQCNFSFVYDDGTERFIDSIVYVVGQPHGKWVTVDLRGFGLKLVNYGFFNITYKVDAGIATDLYIYFIPITSSEAGISIWLDYGGGSGFDAYIDQYFKIDANNRIYLYLNRTGENYYLGPGGSTGWVYRGKVNFGDYLVSHYTIQLNTPYYFNFTKVGSAWTKEIFWIANPARSFNRTLELMYKSYDFYVINISGGVLSGYKRPSDQIVYLWYQDNVFPGTNCFLVNVSVPEIYYVVIDQPYDYMPKYLVLINWLDPMLVINVTGVNDPLLVKYGLVMAGSNITFYYWSIVFKDGVFLGNYSAGNTIILDPGVYAIIPLQGPFKGNIVYLWVEEWRLVKGG